jgi:hypothetical protein
MYNASASRNTPINGRLFLLARTLFGNHIEYFRKLRLGEADAGVCSTIVDPEIIAADESPASE